MRVMYLTRVIQVQRFVFGLRQGDGRTGGTEPSVTRKGDPVRYMQDESSPRGQAEYRCPMCALHIDMGRKASVAMKIVCKEDVLNFAVSKPLHL